MGLSYADAVSLMGGRNSRVVATLDQLTGGLLLAASATGAGFALSLLGARSELARVSDELVRELGQRIRRLDRFTRTERLAAAHSIVVLIAYFDALAGADLPFGAEELEFTKGEQVALAGGVSPRSRQLAALAATLLRAEVPMPAPQRPYEATLEAIKKFYSDLSAGVVRFVSGIAVWDRLDDTRRERFATLLSEELPARAVVGYEERFRQLAAEFPEVRFWANLTDHQATRAEVRRLGTGMLELERMLTDMAAGRVPDERRSGLSRAYRMALERPVLATGDVSPGLHLPSLGDAYVDPDFRAAEAAGISERFTDESWWNQQQVRDDLEEFLIGHLTAPQAVKAPLLVLGQPGSGKSALTRVLAARLPPDKFLVVRVALRDVPADADLQAQIENAIRSATGESLSWPDLARSAADALPIVLLDGFDELMQATGVSQTDYLDKVAMFQEREANLGRPVAAVVTSRTAVANDAKPTPGMVAIRLEPFHEAQVSLWLDVWNRINAAEFTARGLSPLTAQMALKHAELASQPLLLVMLALYYAEGNPLQRDGAVLSEAELYERLLVGFAEREIGKTGVAWPDESRAAVERELLGLSVAAFAMFSRSRQWISDAELDADLPVLLGTPGWRTNPAGFRAPLTVAQVLVGRFFFVHEAQATRDDTHLHTYEFLHETFGEYLIARLITRELEDLIDAAEHAAGRIRLESVDDAFLYALLSFMPLTMRGTIVSFIAERIQALAMPRRHQLRAMLIRMLGGALDLRHDSRYHDYMPLSLPVPTRCAAFSANLVVLAVLATGEVAARALFPVARDPVQEWCKFALLWRSQLPPEGWAGLVDAITLDRIWHNDQRDIVLAYGKERGQRPHVIDPHWSYNLGPGSEYRKAGGAAGWMLNDYEWLRDQAWFLCDKDDDTVAHTLNAFADDFDAVICSFHSYWPTDGHAVSAASALVTLWLTSGGDCRSDELVAAFDTCLEIAIRARFAPNQSKIRERFRVLVLRQLAADRHRLPPDWLNSVVFRIQDAENKKPDEVRGAAELLRIARDIIPEPIDAVPPGPGSAKASKFLPPW